jgi:hypothetical protein
LLPVRELSEGAAGAGASIGDIGIGVGIGIARLLTLKLVPAVARQESGLQWLCIALPLLLLVVHEAAASHTRGGRREIHA